MNNFFAKLIGSHAGGISWLSALAGILLFALLSLLLTVLLPTHSTRAVGHRRLDRGAGRYRHRAVCPAGGGPDAAAGDTPKQ